MGISYCNNIKISNNSDFNKFTFRFAKKINRAFKSMMFLHISVTSFIISILGYQILFAESYINSLSYSLHLAGWLVLFFCVCYNGQNLINGVLYKVLIGPIEYIDLF